MSNVKKTIDTQKAINEAVEAVFEYLKKDISYAEILETMVDAQRELLHLTEINEIVNNHPSLGIESADLPNIKDINNLLYEHSCLLKLLRPFAKLMGQVYGSED